MPVVPTPPCDTETPAGYTTIEFPFHSVPPLFQLRGDPSLCFSDAGPPAGDEADRLSRETVQESAGRRDAQDRQGGLRCNCDGWIIQGKPV